MTHDGGEQPVSISVLISPSVPVSDNKAGDTATLLAANAEWRLRPWPAPHDRCEHRVIRGDARHLHGLPDASVHLVVTSPPYFDLKPYASDAEGAQLGRIPAYDEFLAQLDMVWRECERVLVAGGRVCCNVGDVMVARKSGRDGRHHVLPLPADIQVRARLCGLDNLTPIMWSKRSNGIRESAGKAGGFYGKPYQPGMVIKNDMEHVLMLRKPGYRSPTSLQRVLSMLARHEMDAWARQVWSDIPGASLQGGHPAPFPVALAERLVRMFSFAGDLVLDPFAGSGTTAVAALRAGRSSVSVEVEQAYHAMAKERLTHEAALPRTVGTTLHCIL